VNKFSVLVERFQPRRKDTLFGDADLIIPKLRPAIRGRRPSIIWESMDLSSGAPLLGVDGCAPRSCYRQDPLALTILFLSTRDRFSARAIEQLLLFTRRLSKPLSSRRNPNG
jgi:hypothetical protein